MGGFSLFPPAPSVLTPKSLVKIAAVLDEPRELHLGHGCPRDGKGANLDGMFPFLVIEYKRLVRFSFLQSGPEPVRTSWYFHVSWQRPCLGVFTPPHAEF